MKLSMLISTWATGRDEEYMKRQETCLYSWMDFAHRVLLVNRRDDAKHLNHIEIVEPMEEHPTLAQLMKVAAQGRGLYDHDTIGIINADVGLAGSLDPLEKYVRQRQVGRAYAASSLRIENGDIQKSAYDFFIATKKVWKEFRDVPSYLKLGVPMWDVWLNSRLKLNVGGHRYCDITPLKLTNHAPHENGGRILDVGMNTIPISGWGPAETKITP